MNIYIEHIYQMTDFITEHFDISKLNLPSEIFSFFDKSSRDFLNHVIEFVQAILMKILNVITSMPTIGIYIVITILATYFICADRLYILDQMEHHFPKLWVKRIGNHVKDISHKLGNYLKAELILVSISFVIILIGLYIFKWIGFDIKYPLLMAFIIGFVDALPILGAGTVMLPWAVISAVNNQLRFGICLLVLYIITVIARQILEPKIISNQIGIHPIFTLIAMYTGFEFLGILGILLGPIILIIVKDIYATVIDKGVVKSILERK